jgi:starch-binding outer membrane protein, SusD/RagB family
MLPIPLQKKQTLKHVIHRRALPKQSTPVASLLLVCALVGCDVTRLSNPSLIQPSNLQNPAGAQELRLGALGALAASFSYQSVITGLFADEFRVSSVSLAGSYPEDQRSLTPTSANNSPFAGLSGGRINALIAINDLKQYSANSSADIGELYALVAATEILFEENLCSGIPLGAVNGFTPSYGPTLSRAQLSVRAMQDLDSAAAYSKGTDSIESLAAVLRGRALLNNGQFAAAASAVQGVPQGFSYSMELGHSAAGDYNTNAIFTYVNSGQAFSVSDSEGINGLPFVSAGDVRVPTIAESATPPIYVPAFVSSDSTPVTLASGIEAQLIIAEAALATGHPDTWATILNHLRQFAITPAIAPLSSDSTSAASVDLRLGVMFRERAFWLFGTGHRLGDLRRLVRQYHLVASAVFPNGLYMGGPQIYGQSVDYPVYGEQNDPNYHGCLDLSA